jgi:outer membrane lipoprotein SlyB
MKKPIATFLCLLVLTFAAVPAGAQTRPRRQQVRTSAQQSRYEQKRYEQSRYDDYRERSIWDKHRDKITTAGGAVAGAVIGGLVGGKKGAVIGALGGGGGAAIYTYKIRKKDRNY